jgi:hypothetical protein
MAACERLGGAVKDADSAWLPVAEAVVLLNKTREFAEFGLSQAPTRQVTARVAAGAASLETDPDKTGMTREIITVIESRASDLMNDAERLHVAVRQSALRAAFSRGTWWGLEARDYLLLCVFLAALIGWMMTWQARTLWETSPAQALEAELRLLAHGEPQAAVERCFARSGELLKLADTFLIQSKLRKGGADVVHSPAAD